MDPRIRNALTLVRTKGPLIGGLFLRHFIAIALSGERCANPIVESRLVMLADSRTQKPGEPRMNVAINSQPFHMVCGCPLPQVPDVDASVDVPNVSGDELSASLAVPGERLRGYGCGSVEVACCVWPQAGHSRQDDIHPLTTV